MNRLPQSGLFRAIALIGVSATLAFLPGCGASVEKSSSAPTGEDERPRPGATEREKVEAAFNAYYASLVRKDFAAACDRLTPDAQEKLVENLRESGGRITSCTQAFAARDERGRPLLDKFVPAFRTAKATTVRVSGDRATIKWTANYLGRNLKLNQSARKVGGEWKLTKVLG